MVEHCTRDYITWTDHIRELWSGFEGKVRVFSSVHSISARVRQISREVKIKIDDSWSWESAVELTLVSLPENERVPWHPRHGFWHVWMQALESRTVSFSPSLFFLCPSEPCITYMSRYLMVPPFTEWRAQIFDNLRAYHRYLHASYENIFYILDVSFATRDLVWTMGKLRM